MSHRDPDAKTPATARRPVDKPRDNWGEVPGAPVDDWKYAVANGDTRLGYWSWAASKLEADAVAEQES
jgi:hypothetical protein